MANLEDLIEVTKLIEEKNSNKAPIKELLFEKDSLYEKLFDLIAKGKISTDGEAIEEIYGSLNVKSKYYKLKSRLYDKLLDALFLLIQTPASSPRSYSEAYPLVYKQHSAIKILVGNFCRRSAIRLSEKLIKKSIKFGFTDLTLDLARTLRIHYSSIDVNEKKSKLYDEVISNNIKILTREIEAEKYYCELSKHFTNSFENDQKQLKKAERYSQVLLRRINGNSSYREALFSFYVIIMSKELIGATDEVIALSKKALDFFHPAFLSKSVKFGFQLKIIESRIKKTDYDLALKEINGLYSVTPINSINWFELHYLKFTLYNHLGEYALSRKVYVLAISSEYFPSMPEYVKEKWKINEAIINYLISLGKVPGEAKFKLNKFINSIPIYSKDKKGANICVLILQILFFLKRRDYGGIIDRSEALRMYSGRYLKDKDAVRSKYFLRMLLLLPAVNFEKDRAAHRAKKYVEKLEKTPLPNTPQSLELEFIPYLTLWQFVLESLD